MSTAKVVSFASKRAEHNKEEAFLELLQEDIDKNPEKVRPVTKALFDRIESLRLKAEKNEKADALEC